MRFYQFVYNTVKSYYKDHHNGDYNRGKPKRAEKQNRYKENPRRDNNAQISSQTDTVYKQEIKIDYSFVFNAMFKLIKEYITNRTKLEAIKEEEFILAHETIYQLIIIIEKLDNRKLYELNSLANFGIEIDVVGDLKNILIKGVFNKDTIATVLNSLVIKKILIIYKYFNIAVNKIDGLFYKLGKSVIFLFFRNRTGRIRFI